MELKDWTYEELPEFTEPVEGVSVLSATGDEVSVTYLSDVAYAEVGVVTLHLQILQPGSRNRPEMVCPCVVFVQGSAWFPQNVYTQIPRLSKLAARGYVVAIVEYRHSGLAPFRRKSWMRETPSAFFGRTPRCITSTRIKSPSPGIPPAAIRPCSPV